MTPGRLRLVVLAAVICGLAVAVVVLTSDHQEDKPVWAFFGATVGWNFIGTGLYASRRWPESRIGLLMACLGFAWFLSTLEAADSPLVYTVGLAIGGLWGGVFLHLGMSFPSGRLSPGIDRALVLAGYPIFTLAMAPALLFAGPEELDCPGCPVNLLLVRRDEDLATAALLAGVVSYAALFSVVLVRVIGKWLRTAALDRLQLTPVYVFSLLAFLLVTAARAGGGDAAWWAAFIASALLPFAFLGGMLRSQVSHLDAELKESHQELRASRARLVEAGDAERRRLERNLHDGAQSRLVALALLLGSARRRAERDPELASLLERAQQELQTSLDELRELARGIHPAVLTERGLTAALESLVARAPVPVELVARTGQRLPEAVESAAYFVVSEALANVAKYAAATEAKVAVEQIDGRVRISISDDGIGGADATRGTGLRGLADRVAALDGTLSVESPRGAGTSLRVEIPVRSD